MLSTLIELQRLKRLDRTGWTLRGLPNGTESVAAHSFGVSAAAMLIADETHARGAKVDVGKVMKMALLHDWAETRIGDMPKTAVGYFGAKVRRKAELAAFADVIADAGVSAGEYQKIYEEYEERKTVEARIVKSADIIDLLVQVLALERAGARGLDEFWEAAKIDNFALEDEAYEVVDELLSHIVEARRAILR